MRELREIRTSLGLSQEAFGRAIGVSNITVSRWELGVNLPRRGLWPKIEAVTGKSVPEIMAGNRQ